jgi:hypothetical protein
MEVRGQHENLAVFAWERTRYPLNRRQDSEKRKSLGVYLVDFFFETYA